MKKLKYFITIDSIDSKNLNINHRPEIFSAEVNFPILKIQGPEVEGPFETLENLKKNSTIYSKIENHKTRQSILKPLNIKEIKKITLVPFEHSYELNFIKMFLHVWVGKISSKDVSGIHFYTAENTKILKILEINPTTKVYSALISSLNKEKDSWIEKSHPTNFFPDDWSVQKLFKELDTAYNNKTEITDSMFIGRTSENIQVKFIIKNGNALTMYPLIN